MTTRRDVLALAALGMAASTVRPVKAAAPSGQLTVGVHITLAPTWLDPAETAGIITPFMVMYALHDAVAKPMPQGNPSPSLAESWSAGEDGLSYEFVLRKDAKFHNGDPVTADDVKFSFERYRGAAHGLLKERVASVEAPDPQRVVFKLKNPWPDFITFYTVASGAGWVVPRKYVEKVGEDGFKKAPIGAGPYKFVSFTPGIELVLEAFDQYWRKTPSVKRIVMKVIPDESTRLAALKNGEVDIAYSIRAELAEELQRTPGLTLRPTVGSAPYYLYFPEQWDPKSPWYDKRVRLATKYALDYNTINKALTLGHSHITGSVIPENFEFYEKLAPPVYDPEKARQLLAEAGMPAASMPASIPAMSPMRTSARRRSTIWARSAFAPSCGRWNVLHSSEGMQTRSTRTLFRAHRVLSATPPRDWRSSWSRAATTRMAAIRKSTNCSRCRRSSWIARNARRS